MRTIKLTLAYDGTAYAGWQVQPNCPTVQATLEAAIEKVTRAASRTLASGRTDAGVHALGQVASFQTDSELPVDVLLRAFNAELPKDIVVHDVAEVADDFHPIADAVTKRYRYVMRDAPIREIFLRPFCWDFGRGHLDVDAMSRAAKSLLGKHDFQSFETTGAPRDSSVRTISDIFVRRTDTFSLHETMPSRSVSAPESRAPESRTPEDGAGQGGWILFEVEADGFLYNMVRAIVGSLVEVGRGAQGESWIAEILAAKDRTIAGPTAPPGGLFLVRVDYEE